LRVLLSALALGAVFGAIFARLNTPQGTHLETAAPRTNWAAQLPSTIDAITAALRRLPIPLATPELRPRGAGKVRWIQHHYEIAMSAPDDPEVVRTWFHAVEQAAPAVGTKLIIDGNGAEVMIGVDGLLTHTLSLHWLGRKPRAAIVLTGLGNNLRTARAAVTLGINVTLAIDAPAPFAREVATVAKQSDVEVLVHVPLYDPGSDSLADTAQWAQALDTARATIAGAAGIYVDAPPGLSVDAAARQQILALGRERQLFAVDGTSELCKGAEPGAGPCLTRDIVLDPNTDAEAIRLLLESVITLVRTRGDVIVVGPAQPVVLDALRQMAPAFAAAQVQIVPTSLIAAERVSLSAR